MNDIKQNIPILCKIGLHRWSAWVDKRIIEKFTCEEIMGQQRRCIKCNKRNLRAVIRSFYW